MEGQSVPEQGVAGQGVRECGGVGWVAGQGVAGQGVAGQSAAGWDGVGLGSDTAPPAWVCHRAAAYTPSDRAPTQRRWMRRNR